MEVPQRRLERLPDVLARTGISRSMAYREAAAGRFPKPLKIGSISAWNSEEIDCWIDELSAQDTKTGGLN